MTVFNLYWCPKAQYQFLVRMMHVCESFQIWADYVHWTLNLNMQELKAKIYHSLIFFCHLESRRNHQFFFFIPRQSKKSKFLLWFLPSFHSTIPGSSIELISWIFHQIISEKLPIPLPQKVDAPTDQLPSSVAKPIEPSLWVMGSSPARGTFFFFLQLTSGWRFFFFLNSGRKWAYL
jgi:hypothetical protein